MVRRSDGVPAPAPGGPSQSQLRRPEAESTTPSRMRSDGPSHRRGVLTAYIERLAPSSLATSQFAKVSNESLGLACIGVVGLEGLPEVGGHHSE